MCIAVNTGLMAQANLGGSSPPQRSKRSPLILLSEMNVLPFVCVRVVGKSRRQLTASEIRQIAGRAGRYKPPPPPPASFAAGARAALPPPHAGPDCSGTGADLANPDMQRQQQQEQEGGEEAFQPQQGQALLGSGSGYVTVLDGRDLWALHCALAEPHAELKQACLMP
eukprot:scaffold317515_cov15-Tisochrysis_lutea.AAC.1